MLCLLWCFQFSNNLADETRIGCYAKCGVSSLVIILLMKPGLVVMFIVVFPVK